MFESLTIVIIIIGMAFVFISYYVKEQKEDHAEKAVEEYEEYQLKLKEISDKMLELNDYSEFIKKELEDKHSELLFLYHMISEKSKLVENDTGIVKESGIKEENFDEGNDKEMPVSDDVMSKVQQSKAILNLYKEGKTVTEIARTLGVGKGEVNLTLNLFK